MAEHQPAVVYLAYPNNPDRQPVRRGRHGRDRARGPAARSAGDLVVVDEAYQPFAQDTAGCRACAISITFW
ncbi:hypothetical protein ACU4GD_43695 [Cupriavidus basilensis]